MASKYAVLYIETDCHTDPKLVSKPVDTKDEAMGIAKSLWEAELKKLEIPMPKPNEYGHLYSKKAYCGDDHCELIPYSGARYKHKWLVIKVPQK